MNQNMDWTYEVGHGAMSFLWPCLKWWRFGLHLVSLSFRFLLLYKKCDNPFLWQLRNPNRCFYSGDIKWKRNQYWSFDIYYFEIGISSPTETYHFGFCFCVSEVFSLSWTFSILCYLFSFSHFYCYFLLLWRGGRREEV